MVQILKQLLPPLASPLTLAVLFAVWALLHKRRRVLLLCVTVALLLLFGYPVLSGRLRRPLVTRYAPIKEFQAGITNIVVLCAGRFRDDASLPLTGRVIPESLYRLLEGIRVHREVPGSRVLVSVNSRDGPADAERVLDRLSELVGVRPDCLVPVVGAKTTLHEARLMRNVVGTNAFYLVTSDLHMRRSMMIFEQAGMQPVAAPVGRCGRDDGGRPRLGSIYPKSEHLRSTDEALHEYLGMLWAKLVGPTTDDTEE